MDEWTVTSPSLVRCSPNIFQTSVYSTLIEQITVRHHIIYLAYANDNFKVASCNDDSAVSMKILFRRDEKQKFIIIIKERRPELTIQVAESYYTNNLSGQEGFVLADGYYSKKISEDELDLTFSDDADGMSTKICNEILK